MISELKGEDVPWLQAVWSNRIESTSSRKCTKEDAHARPTYTTVFLNSQEVAAAIVYGHKIPDTLGFEHGLVPETLQGVSSPTIYD
jgi:hypothetical protein